VCTSIVVRPLDLQSRVRLPAAALPSSDPGQVVHTCPALMTTENGVIEIRVIRSNFNSIFNLRQCRRLCGVRCKFIRSFLGTKITTVFKAWNISYHFFHSRLPISVETMDYIPRTSP